MNEEERAKVLLPIREGLRRHWSNYINNLLNFQIAIQVGIWSFFGKSIVGALETSSGQANLQAYQYFVIAASISSIAIGVWRIYARHIEDQSTKLYPEILLYELQLGVEPPDGISQYLPEDIVAALKKHYRRATPQRCANALRKLAKKRRLGSLWAKNWSITYVVAITILMLLTKVFLVFLVLVFVFKGALQSVLVLSVVYGGIGCMSLGLILSILACCRYQKQPSGADIEEFEKDLDP